VPHTAAHAAPPDELWSRRRVARYLGVSPSSVWAWSRDGRLPAGMKLSPTVVRWSANSVREWAANKQPPPATA
jgi:predicted DNA-binding transcriptional regulator AlpA